MARQNFQHGKRQRELAKKQKRDEKLQRKLEKKNNPEAEPEAGQGGSEAEDSGASQPEAEP